MPQHLRPGRKTSSLLNFDAVHEEPHDAAYPLFIAEKFLSSGLFAGPPLLHPVLLFQASSLHLLPVYIHIDVSFNAQSPTHVGR
jgi:hypothetical protein